MTRRWHWRTRLNDEIGESDERKQLGGRRREEEEVGGQPQDDIGEHDPKMMLAIAMRESNSAGGAEKKKLAATKRWHWRTRPKDDTGGRRSADEIGGGDHTMALEGGEEKKRLTPAHGDGAAETERGNSSDASALCRLRARVAAVTADAQGMTLVR